MDWEKVKALIQEKLDVAMPWVGLYIAAASAVCTLAIAADTFNGFQLKKLWFPCKYFSLNAISLTWLAVATKLPVDLNTNMVLSNIDWLAKLISLIFMSTTMANFMPSLGSMTNNEVFANTAALFILVITITGNVCIQIVELWGYLDFDVVINIALIIIVPMLLLLVMLVSLAITLPTTKRSLESKYQDKHKVALKEEEVLCRRESFRLDNQRGYMMKYLVMAETSSPQFVIARSVVCSSAAIMCLFVAIIVVIEHVSIGTKSHGESPYGDSTKVILYIQSVGVHICTIAPMLRWFEAVGFRCSRISWESVRREFKIEAYWTQTLVDCRDRFSPLQFRKNKCRKYLHDVKWFALTLCIGLQILIVLFSKLLVFFSVLLIFPFFWCLTLIIKLVKQARHEDQDGGDIDSALNDYMLVLEGEPLLPTRAVKKITGEADNIIKTGKKEQPKSLVNLLNKFINFKGVREFDQIGTLHSEEPPNNWALPIVTLTSIAIALPNIAKDERRLLLNSVGEGLSLVKIVQKTLVQNTELVNIKKAADICWVGVTLYKKWLEFDLENMSAKCGGSKALLQELSEKAESIMAIFKMKEQDTENPLNWPPKVLAANSMYRITQTILLSYGDEQTNEGLYERLSVMIADILAACLTNIPRAITTMCHRNAIEKREKSVRKAFFLLGKTEQVVQFLQQKECPNMDHDKAVYIDEWRALFQQP